MGTTERIGVAGAAVLTAMYLLGWMRYGDFKLFAALSFLVYAGYWLHKRDVSEKFKDEFSTRETFKSKDEVIEAMEQWANQRYKGKTNVNLAVDDVMTTRLRYDDDQGDELLHATALQTGDKGKEVMVFFRDSMRDGTFGFEEHRPLWRFDNSEVWKEPFNLSEYWRQYMRDRRYQARMQMYDNGSGGQSVEFNVPSPVNADSNGNKGGGSGGGGG